MELSAHCAQYRIRILLGGLRNFSEIDYFKGYIGSLNKYKGTEIIPHVSYWNNMRNQQDKPYKYLIEQCIFKI